MTTVTHAAELNNGKWTSWLPLTTAYPSKSACNSQAWARNGVDPSINYFPYIYDVAYGLSVANTLTCLPPEVSQWWSGAATVLNTVTSWSIGPIVCPAAFTTASTSIVSGSSTSVFCCPTGFTIAYNLPMDPGLDGVCTSAFTSGQKLVYASPTSNSFVSVTTTFTVQTAYMVANPVEGYNFAISSTSSSSSSTSTGGSSTSSTSATSASSSTTGTALPANTDTHTSGLSTGAKAGIGAGVAVLALVIAAIVGFLLFRRRRKYATGPVSELPGYGQENKHQPPALVEAHSDVEPPRSEMDGRTRPAELAG